MRHSSGFRYFLRHPIKACWKLSRHWLGQVSPLYTLQDLICPCEFSLLIERGSEHEFNASCDNMYHYGGSKQRQRLADLAEWSLGNYPGDLLEIGAFCGETSRLFAEIAARFGRRLIVIDPWITGSQDCDGMEFEAFQKNIEPFRDHVDVWRSSSLEDSVIRRLKQRPLSFSFVDGLHTLKACFSDILAAGHTRGVIAVDDTRYNHDLIFAVRHAACKLGRYAVQEPSLRESYLLPTDRFTKRY
jgi:hypothetical protein